MKIVGNRVLKVITLPCMATLFAASIQLQAEDKQDGVQRLPLMETAQPFASLPDSCPTPDAMVLDPLGALTLSCPNFADRNAPGFLLSIKPDGKIVEIGTITTPDGLATPMGLAYGDEGELYVANNAGPKKGSLLRVSIKDDKIVDTSVVASGMSSPNGVRYYNEHVYLTQLQLPLANTEKLSSGLYRFHKDDRNINVASDLSSPNLVFSTQTENMEKQYGLDGLIFDEESRLYVTNFGDAIVYRFLVKKDGSLSDETVFAQLPIEAGVDGIAIDSHGVLYVAGFSRNEIYQIDSSGAYRVIARYPDNDGSNGGIDQPADVFVVGEKLIISNFDLMKGKGMVNTGHSKPYTLSAIDLRKFRKL